MTRPLRRVVALLVVAAAALLSVASDPLPPPPPEWLDESDFPVEVGLGIYRFDPYGDDEPLPMERGFQGGQHINTNLRLGEVEPGDEAEVVEWLVRADESVVVSPESGPTYIESGADYGHEDEHSYAFGNTLFIEQPDALLGSELELRIQLTTSDGRIGRASHRGPVSWLPDDWIDEPLPEVQDGGPSPDGG